MNQGRRTHIRRPWFVPTTGCEDPTMDERAMWEQLEAFVAAGDQRSQLARIHAWCWEKEASLPPEDVVIEFTQSSNPMPGTMPS